MTGDETKKFKERILADVARDNHIIVHPNDPIIILPTIFKLVLDKLLEEEKLALTIFKSDIYQTQKKISDDASAMAQKMVEDATGGMYKLVKDSVGAEINAGCKMIRDAVKKEAQECFNAYGKEFAELKHSGENINRNARLVFYAAALAFMEGMSAFIATLLR